MKKDILTVSRLTNAIKLILKEGIGQNSFRVVSSPAQIPPLVLHGEAGIEDNGDLVSLNQAAIQKNCPAGICWDCLSSSL